MLRGYFLVEMLKDDERFKLKKGDILFAKRYEFDLEKTSIAFRLSDGYRPSCNQYNHSIRRLTADEEDSAIWRDGPRRFA